MTRNSVRLSRLIRPLLLALGTWLLATSAASAQYGGYGYGYGGYGGGPGYGYGGYGGYGGGGYGGYGYAASGYGGYGYGGGGYGYGGGGYGYGGGGYGGGGYYPGFNNVYGQAGSSFVGTGLAGVGYPGIGGSNPYFSFGLSPLAVENAVFERTVLRRTTTPMMPPTVRGSQGVTRPLTTTSGPVGTGTFAPR